MTDLFGGEANYSWVDKHALDLPIDADDKTVVRAAKSAAGWTGLRCDTDAYSEIIEVRPRGLLQVMFIEWEDQDEDR